MNLLELPNDITTDKLNLFCIKDHFSKYGMSFIIKNKVNFLKIPLETNGFSEEMEE